MPMYDALLKDLAVYTTVTKIKEKIRGSNSPFDASLVVDQELDKVVRKVYDYREKLKNREGTILFFGALLGSAATFLIMTIISIG